MFDGVSHWLNYFAILFQILIAEVFCDDLQVSDLESIEIEENYSQSCKKCQN